MIRMINDWGWKIKDSKSINDFPQLDYLLMTLFCDLPFFNDNRLFFCCLIALQIPCEKVLYQTVLCVILCCKSKFVAWELLLQFGFYDKRNNLQMLAFVNKSFLHDFNPYCMFCYYQGLKFNLSFFKRITS